MRQILSTKSFSTLKKFASGDVLLAFDFDGTLAPIISEPRSAGVRPATLRLLRRLASLYPCIVVSGRGRNDVRRKLAGIQFREFVGNHGIEPWKSSRASARTVEAWISSLKKKLGRFHGVVVENKTFSASVHYRHARRKKRVLKEIIHAARTLSGARLIAGKQVLNIVIGKAPDKGLAVERLRRKLGCDRVIYVGDDVTDEDVFALSPGGRFLTIRVGRKESSLAQFYIRNQREIDPLLKALIKLRSDYKLDQSANPAAAGSSR